MNKKNVALLIIIMCVLMILLFATIGNRQFTNASYIIKNVNLYDKSGNQFSTKMFNEKGEEIIEEKDENGLSKYINVETSKAVEMSEDDIKKLTIKYYANLNYKIDDDCFVKIDDIDYVMFEIYAFIDPSNATEPNLKGSIATNIENIDYQIVNKTKEDAEFVRFKINTDDQNKYIVPFVSKLEEETDEEIEYLVIKYVVLIEFKKVNESDYDNEDDYIEALRNAINYSRSCSIDIDFSYINNGTKIVDLPIFNLSLSYTPTKEENAIISEDISQ